MNYPAELNPSGIKLNLLENVEMPQIKNPFYIKLPKVKDAVLRMRETLGKGTNYLEMWA